MKEEIEDILMNSYNNFGLFDEAKATKELLNLFGLSKQSELLKGFVDFYNYRNTGDKRINYDEIEIFIDSL